jgi:ABC-2 type transport system permease protein
VIFCLFAVAWLILPLVVFGLDSTLDPATLALYPLRTRQLAAGLLAASATGAWPAATLLALLGVTIGLARGALGVLIALLIIPIFGVYEGFIQIVPKLTSEGALTAASFGGVDRWLRWTPPGLAVHAIWDASSGHAGTALLRLLLLAGVIGVLVLLWIRFLARAMVTSDTSTQPAVRGSALPFARYGLRGTVAARFWLYQRREPFALTYWGITVIIMAVVGVRAALTPDYLGGLIGSAIAGGAFTAAFHSNAIGLSGPGFGMEATALTSRRTLRAYFAGQNLAVGAIAVPLVAAVTFGLAAMAKHPIDGFLGLAVGLAAVGAGLGLANLLSASSAYPVEKRAGTPLPRAASGHNGEAAGLQLIALLGVGVAATPMILAVVFTPSVPAAVRLPVLMLGGAACGLGLAWAGVRAAAILAEQKLPELAQAAIHSTVLGPVSRRRSGWPGVRGAGSGPVPPGAGRSAAAGRSPS